MDYPIDRLPPHNDEAEQAVLGSILIDPDAIDEMELDPGDFYRRDNQDIFAAMLAVRARGDPPNVVLVAEELHRQGSEVSLARCGNEPTSIYAAQYAAIVRRKAVLRRLIGAAGKIAAIGYEDGADLDEARSRAEETLAAVWA